MIETAIMTEWYIGPSWYETDLVPMLPELTKAQATALTELVDNPCPETLAKVRALTDALERRLVEDDHKLREQQSFADIPDAVAHDLDRPYLISDADDTIWIRNQRRLEIMLAVVQAVEAGAA